MPEVVDWLLETHYRPIGRAMRRCHPRDLLTQVRNYCVYNNYPLEMRQEYLDRIVTSYFTAVGAKKKGEPTPEPKPDRNLKTQMIGAPVDKPEVANIRMTQAPVPAPAPERVLKTQPIETPNEKPEVANVRMTQAPVPAPARRRPSRSRKSPTCG